MMSLLRILLLVAAVVGGFAWVVRQPVLLGNGFASPRVDPGKLEAHVRFLSEDCSPRHFLARENQLKAANYISDHLRASGARVEWQEFSTRSGKYANVVGHFGETNPRRIVIGAHYDVCGTQPGADDNASGVAGLLELAALLGRAPSLDTHVELVAYNLEEPPFFAGEHMGSAIHARNLRKRDVQIALMVSLEMIGYFSDEQGSQEYPNRLLGLIYPSRGDFIALVGRWDQRSRLQAFKKAAVGAAEIPVVSIAAPSFLPAVDFSDHRNYWSEGYPALMVTDTAFLRNRNYHQPTDTAATLDYQRMAEVVRLVYAGVLCLREP
ncbi:MAG: M28 family peptidase [Opitutaceae bacterium]|nr:M28 family peptidase [Opitutaceae bacterium]